MVKMLDLSSRKFLSVFNYREISPEEITCNSVRNALGQEAIRVSSKNYAPGSIVVGHAISHLLIVTSGNCSIRFDGKSVSLREGLATVVGNGYHEVETPPDSGCEFIVAWLRSALPDAFRGICLCPVCGKGSFLPPNLVCADCFARLKTHYVHSYEQLRADAQRRAQSRGMFVDNDQLESLIAADQQAEAEEWDEVVGTGLTAARVLADIVDDYWPGESTPDNGIGLQWHRRRIRLLAELVTLLPERLFSPADTEQVSAYVNAAIDFWDGKLTNSEKNRTFDDFMNLLGITDPTHWTAKSILRWMMLDQDHLDWIWDQFFNSVLEVIPHELGDATWAALFQHHFPEIIAAWVSGSCVPTSNFPSSRTERSEVAGSMCSDQPGYCDFAQYDK